MLENVIDLNAAEKGPLSLAPLGRTVVTFQAWEGGGRVKQVAASGRTSSVRARRISASDH